MAASLRVRAPVFAGLSGEEFDRRQSSEQPDRDYAHADRPVPHRQLNRLLDLRNIALDATD
jgi:hypothetical protein